MSDVPTTVGALLSADPGETDTEDLLDEAQRKDLSQHIQDVPGLRTGIGHEVVRMDESGHGKPVLRLRVVDGVTAGERTAGDLEDGRAPFEHVGERAERKAISRPADDLECRDGPPAHGVHVGQRVGRGDPAPVVRLVDDRGEEVDRLNQCEVIGQPKDPRIIGTSNADQEVGMPCRRQIV